MKRVFIVRHAKSDWDNNLSDFERPLNKRGNNDAPIMAKKINDLGFRPDIIVSSTAKRAITTAKFFATEFDYAHDCIQKEREIYDIGQRFTLKLITELPQTLNSVMIFGHNPDQSHLATLLSNTQIGNMPTCSVVGVEFNSQNWTNLLKATPKLLCFEYPKK